MDVRTPRPAPRARRDPAPTGADGGGESDGGPRPGSKVRLTTWGQRVGRSTIRRILKAARLREYCSGRLMTEVLQRDWGSVAAGDFLTEVWMRLPALQSLFRC